MKSNIISPRIAKSRFKFDANRDDLSTPSAPTVRVFTTSSPLLHGGDCGVYGAPIVTLTGYVKVEGASSKLNSVQRLDGLGGYIVGRAVELTVDELARLDQFAEATGDYHRFRAVARGPRSGQDFTVWVYQLLEDAGPVELQDSAVIEVPSRELIEA